MHELWMIAIWGLVSYRVTRFLLKDTLIEVTRERLYGKILTPEAHVWRDKLYDLLNCPYCLSVYISAATVAVADIYGSVPMPVYAWLATAAATMVWWRIVEREPNKE